MIYVLYHKNCMDGKGAAYAAWLKFKQTATYLEVNYGEDLPTIKNNSEVYILDFSYSKEILEKLNSRCKKVIVLDHHKTAEESLKNVPFAIFNMNKSGASLAYEYFHSNETKPDHIRYVEDRDLWNWKLPDSKQYSLGAYSLIKTFTDFHKFTAQDLIDAGYTIETYQSQLIETILANSYLTTFGIGGQTQYSVATVNSPVLQSELGNLLLQKYPDCDFSYVYREDQENTYISLRSEDSKVDVSIIAKVFGGGGHRNASGFTFKRRN